MQYNYSCSLHKHKISLVIRHSCKILHGLIVAGIQVPIMCVAL